MSRPQTRTQTERALRDEDVLPPALVQELRARIDGAQLLVRERGERTRSERRLPGAVVQLVREELALQPDPRANRVPARTWNVLVRGPRDTELSQVITVLAPHHPAHALAFALGIGHSRIYRTAEHVAQLQAPLQDTPASLLRGLAAIRQRDVPDEQWPDARSLVMARLLERSTLATRHETNGYLNALANILRIKPIFLRTRALEVSAAIDAVTQFRAEHQQPGG